jgi:hypothetical protein
MLCDRAGEEQKEKQEKKTEQGTSNLKISE